jgi:hypothetical protein
VTVAVQTFGADVGLAIEVRAATVAIVFLAAERRVARSAVLAVAGIGEQDRAIHDALALAAAKAGAVGEHAVHV